jgi:ABC-type glycerol-3-phosphate transport system permease component
LSLLTDFDLESAFSGIRIATPACFQALFAWNIFFPPFTLTHACFLPVNFTLNKVKKPNCLDFNEVTKVV